ncbi:MAG: hypothetical protein GY893_07220 [bacterium]|nr:hypothetical protein [bacterium]
MKNKTPDYLNEEFSETWDLLGDIETPELGQPLVVDLPSHGNLFKIGYGFAVAASVAIGVMVGSFNFNSVSEPGIEGLMTGSSFSNEDPWSLDIAVVSLFDEEVN